MRYLALAMLAAAVAGLTFEVTQNPASFKNIRIASQKTGMAPCEPSIAISKKNPKNIVAGVILDRALPTTDGGATWGDVTLSSPHGVFGDPTLLSDHLGHFYYFHLSNTGGDGWIDRIVCQKSTDGGKSWTPGAGIGHNPPKDQDKQWAAVHPTKAQLVVTWTQFDTYGSKDPRDTSNIMFSQSVDGGETWSEALRINDISGDCVDSDKTTEGAVPTITSDGTIHVVWSVNDVIFHDLTKDGKKWLANDRPIARHYGGWDMDIPGVNRSNGMPVLMSDNSDGANKGNLYVVWGDKRLAETDADILFMRSTNGGQTWSSPMTINKDRSGRHQFLPWMAVDQTTGYVYILYYDRRAYEDNRTDVYLAYSTDGGKTFIERKISESAFTPTAQAFLGDYNNISAHAGVITPIWTRMDSGQTTVWTAVIKQADLIRN